MIWVLDASVAVKWFFTDEPLRDGALAVRRMLARYPMRFVVPHLFYSEMIHVLGRKSGNDAAFVATGCSQLLRLGLRTVGLSDTGWRACAEWCTRGMSGYDATYVALAEELHGRWITADADACAKAGRLGKDLAGWNTGAS